MRIRLRSNILWGLLSLIGLSWGDEAIKITPASGLFFGPEKTLRVTASHFQANHPRVTLEQYDNGFESRQRRQTDRWIAAQSVLERMVEIDHGQGWRRQCRTRSQLDDQGRVIQINRTCWDGNQWTPTTRVTIDYKQDHPVRQISELWDMDQQTWVPNYQLESQWDQGQNMMDVHYEWTDGNGDGQPEWNAFAVDTYDYDAKGFTTQWQHSWLKADGSWLLAERIAYDYDATGRRTVKCTQSRLDPSWPMENLTKTTFSYDDQGQLSATREFNWNGATWDAAMKTHVLILPDGTVSRHKMRVDDQRFVQANTPVILTNPTG